MNRYITVLFICACLFNSACSKKAAKVEPSKGELTFIASCKVCHAQGINGAPILGNLAMWKNRKDQPLETLVSHAIEGYGLMPAKGGNTELTEDEIREAIQFMLSKLEKN